MKTQIENIIRSEKSIEEFNYCVAVCTSCVTESGLRTVFFECAFTYFKIYFGSNHLAVIEIETGNRILFVDFNQNN